MKKRILGIITAIICVVSVSAFFTGCTSLTDAEKEVVGVYELYEISVQGYPNITKNTYTYFEMEFKSDRKCIVKSKAGSTEYEAEATWKINADGEIEVVTKKGFATATEKYKYEDGFISGTNSDVVEGTSITMTIKMKKIIEE